eukprot:GHVP01040032.1.p1 GENE.GHVP01040032.1~~GHVP01040032.1.p1  ORF type:complete len:440 (-),score=65.07 GHVP01040032.1:849-2168(-)
MDNKNNELLGFLTQSPTPYHAVDCIKRTLLEKGYTEGNNLKLQKGGKYYFERDGTSLLIVSIGAINKSTEPARIVCTHTDSPCLRIRNKSISYSEGVSKVLLDTYGGGLWFTWFDRDLSAAGNVIYEKNGKLNSCLIDLKEPFFRIPSAAIHLQPECYKTGVVFNKETHLSAIISTANEKESPKCFLKYGLDKKHGCELLNLIAKNLPKDINIISFDLLLYETTSPCLIGGEKEFISSGRLDNLLMTRCAIEGILESRDGISIAGLFNNEEVGSDSRSGAGSNFIEEVLKKIETSCGIEVRRDDSFIISADNAHSVHPNYPELHEKGNKPLMNKGPVIKFNANQRYCTTPESYAFIAVLLNKTDIPYQEFTVPNDKGCGSTIGPITSTALGIRGVDIGNAQLSMHSIREVAGIKDYQYMVGLMKAFYLCNLNDFGSSTT